jgi:type III restriction enzyme
MNTLLIDSQQIESGDALDANFRKLAEAEIEQFRREKAQREGAASSEAISDSDLLREVMNTVGKEGRRGEQIRCVVSVSMLTEGWDTNTVTHILGVRAFGTQLLCEQMVGRGLRRLSYDLNADDKFSVEYADILGIVRLRRRAGEGEEDGTEACHSGLCGEGACCTVDPLPEGCRLSNRGAGRKV